tara:strand:+ start:5300 stop:6364 length:1065 start_codon:yes stop_codon:yes gene_type:complete
MAKCDWQKMSFRMTAFDFWIPRQIELNFHKDTAELAEAQAKAMAIIGNTVMGETLLSHYQDMFSPLPKIAWKYNWATIAEIGDKMIEQQFLDNNSTRSMEETAIVTREIDANGKQYFLIHLDFDVPESVCPAGDPQTRRFRNTTCTNDNCPCKTFVSKVLIFDSQYIDYKPFGAPIMRFYRDQCAEFADGAVYAHGSLKRSEVVSYSSANRIEYSKDYRYAGAPFNHDFDISWFHAYMKRHHVHWHRGTLAMNWFAEDEYQIEEPSEENLVRGEYNAAPYAEAAMEPMDIDLEVCPFQVGDRVVKISGIGYGLEGTVIFINEERTKIRVQKDTGSGGEYSVWRLQRFSNYSRGE